MKLLTKIISLTFILFSLNLYAQDRSENIYLDSNNNEVFLPQGKKSFVDKSINVVKGYPRARGKCTNAGNALGEPDYDGNPMNQKNFFSLGCGGEAVFEFVDNGLVDQEGPDLYIFEIGPSIEPTQIYVSQDNINWIDVGKTEGGTSSIDLDGKVDNDKIYFYVKLVDLKSTCGGRGGTDGADIDAIAAIGSTLSENTATTNSEIEESFKVKNKSITVTIWDGAKEDGDIIEVILNGRTIITDHVVTRKGKTIEVNLIEGRNTFELKALNVGLIHPNTASIKIDDGSNKYIRTLSSETGKSKILEINLE